VHSSLPYHFYVYVDNSYLGPEMPSGFTEGILHGIFCKSGQLMLTHVQLQTGAHWSGLPLSALYHKKVNDKLNYVQPWGCMGTEITTNYFPYLDGLSGKVLKENYLFRHTGIIVDWNDGFSRYPQEHKPLSLLALEQGNFALLPNNYFKIYDKHFTEELNEANVNLKKYKRGEVVYWE
jgi:hypothetical protein